MPLSFAACAAEKKQAVLAVLHIFAVGFEHARVGASLRKNFAQHLQIETERGAESETFGQAGRVDIHHHVDERFHFRGFARLADESHGRSKLFQNRFRLCRNASSLPPHIK